MEHAVLTPFYARRHRHEDCRRAALRQAETICQKKGIRLTPIRRMVLEEVWQSHTPAKAYDILEVIDSKDERRMAPPTIYRALDFLLDAGLIHKLDSHNAFVGCGAPGRPHTAQFLICRQCDSVAELNDSDVESALAGRADSLGFKVERESIELEGLCRNCIDG